MKTVIEISAKERYEAAKKEYNEAKKALPKKEPLPYIVERRQFSSDVMDVLCELPKTKRAVHDYLKIGINPLSLCNDKQRDKFNHDQWGQLLKSPTLVIKFMTKMQREKYVSDKVRISPNAYLALMIKGATAKPETFRKTQKLPK